MAAFQASKASWTFWATCSGVRLPRPGRLITLAAPRRTRKSGVISATRFIAGKSFCPFGEAAVWGLQSNLAKFRPEFELQVKQTNPQNVGPVIPIRPTYRSSS